MGKFGEDLWIKLELGLSAANMCPNSCAAVFVINIGVGRVAAGGLIIYDYVWIFG